MSKENAVFPDGKTGLDREKQHETVSEGCRPQQPTHSCHNGEKYESASSTGLRGRQPTIASRIGGLGIERTLRKGLSISIPSLGIILTNEMRTLPPKEKSPLPTDSPVAIDRQTILDGQTHE